MKERFFRIFAAFVVLSLAGCAGSSRGPIQPGKYSETIRVACVGDSITYGSSIKYRLRDCYPAQLGRMLGDKWQTRNFGVGGATLLKKGDKPYWEQQALKDALAFNPHVVVIKLGTNDTKPQNWKFKDQFAADYKEGRDRRLQEYPRQAANLDMLSGPGLSRTLGDQRRADKDRGYSPY